MARREEELVSPSSDSPDRRHDAVAPVVAGTDSELSELHRENGARTVIAAVHGVAFGGGFQIMAGADIRIAHPEVRFAIREAYWGLVPDMAGWPLWRTQVRDDVLRELIYTARVFTGIEAASMGIVTQLAANPHVAALELAL